MRCINVREALSEYLDGGLPPPERRNVAEHLKTCAECGREERQMRQMLSFLHDRLPRHEPVLDIWSEFAPKMAAVRAEEKLGLSARLRLRVHRFWGAVALGAILFTQALAINTAARLHKYLLADPFTEREEGIG